MTKFEEIKTGVIFSSGKKNDDFSQYFIGQSYLKTLVSDPAINIGIGNVTFEPGCRNNWHIHQNSFQILLVTGEKDGIKRKGKKYNFYGLVM